ncbi:hypothetical protein LCGC14_1791880, partial [marine sediment metagenome]
MTKPYDLTNFEAGDFEMAVLAQAFMLPKSTIFQRVLHFIAWGKPLHLEHQRLYYCWQATKMLAGHHGMPTNIAEKNEFLAALFNGYRKTTRKSLDVELVYM